MAGEEVQELLDGLDRRMALGEIDIATYQQLKAKFSSRQGAETDSLTRMVLAMPREARPVQCPGCTAPLPAPSDASQTFATCEHCAGTFELRPAAEAMEALRQDVLKQISEMAGGAGVGSTVDEASRRFIFNEKFLPMLKVAVDRATESNRLMRYQSLFAFPLLNSLSSSPFHDVVRITPDSEYLAEQVRAPIALIQAPETSMFAAGDLEKAQLSGLGVQCQELIHISNSRHYLKSFTPDDLNKAKINLQSLGNLYNDASEKSSTSDPSSNKFFSALANRLDAVEHSVETLEELLGGSDGVMTDQIATKLESHAAQCEQAANDMETAGRDLWEQVPAIQGTRMDAQTIRLFATCVKLYGHCGGESGEPFDGFLESLGQILGGSEDSPSDMNWLSESVSRLTAHTDSIAQEGNTAVVIDFQSIEGRAHTLVRKSLMGGQESLEVESRILVPFWVSEISFSQQKGFVFKKGQAMESLLLIAAYNSDDHYSLIPPDDPLSQACYTAFDSPRPIGMSTPAIIPLITSEEAMSLTRDFISTTKGYVGSSSKSLGLIYLSAAKVKYYTPKAERHETLFASPNIHTDNVTVHKLKLGTKELMSAF